jgi:hypothetical protein
VEDFLESSHRDTVIQNIKTLHLVVEFSEELCKLGSLVVVNFKRYLLRDF